LLEPVFSISPTHYYAASHIILGCAKVDLIVPYSYYFHLVYLLQRGALAQL
jgi:hypothetical protein